MASEGRMRRVMKQRDRALERLAREERDPVMRPASGNRRAVGRRAARAKFWSRPSAVRIDRQVGRQLVARLEEAQ